MRFKITLEIDRDADHKSQLINQLSDEINIFLNKNNYGEDIQNYLLGCICIKTKEGYEGWYKVRKPKYTDYKKVVNRLTGEEMEISKTFENDFKIDNELYEDFIDSSDELSKKILAKEILNSLSNLDSLPKKVKNFDKEKFRYDLRLFFEDLGLI